MDLSISQMKKHLLLYNKMVRSDMKSLIIKTPSKLTDEQTKTEFNKLFKSKNNYYIPKKIDVLEFNEEEFKKIGQKKKAEPKPKPMTKAEPKSMPKAEPKPMTKAEPKSMPKAEPTKSKRELSLTNFLKMNEDKIDRFKASERQKKLDTLENMKKEYSDLPHIIKYLDEEIKKVKEYMKMDEAKKEPNSILNYDILSNELQQLIYKTDMKDINKALLKLNYKGKIYTNKIMLNMQLLQNLKSVDKLKELIDELKK